jgi:hypothetical protein
VPHRAGGRVALSAHVSNAGRIMKVVRLLQLLRAAKMYPHSAPHFHFLQ